MSKSEKIKKIFLGCVNNSSLDETIVEYICGMLEDESMLENEEDLFAMLSPYLMDSGCASNDDEVSALGKQLLSKMSLDGLYRPKKGKEPELQKLGTAVNLGKKSEDVEKYLDWMKSDDRNTLVDKDKLEALESKREKKRDLKAKKDLLKQDKAKQTQSPSLSQFESIHPDANGVANKSRDIKLENFSISLGKEQLLDVTTLSIAAGRRYGLIGRNGSGKTTLLKHIANRELDGIPSHVRILHVEQEVVGDDTTALECVLMCDVERDKLLKDEQRLLKEAAEAPSSDTSARLQKVYERLQQIDAHTAESRASSILAGLGFTTSMQQQATRDFSGGWRMRIALARALFSKPDLLLLDEPTNHLDLYSVLWLEDYLTRWEGSILIVSHQREFLNAVATDIIHLFNKKLEYYKGNYDMFEKVRDDKLKQQQRTFESNQRQRKHIQSFVDRFRYNAKRASLVQSRIKALERMEVIEAISQDPTIVLRFPDVDPLTPPILQFRDASFGFTPEETLFQNLNLGIDMESRVALVGANGVGKSTLLRLLAGEYEPTAGTVLRNGKLRFARFSQHFLDQLDLTLSSIEHFLTVYPNIPVQTVRTHLGSFGLSGDLALRTINTLSGGQKARLVFAVLAWRNPHVLLLDEPTNHLDIETIDSLSNALLNYKGGVLLISHDQRMIELVCDQIWYLSDKTVTVFEGNFDEYKKFLLDQMNTKATITL